MWSKTRWTNNWPKNNLNSEFSLCPIGLVICSGKFKHFGLSLRTPIIYSRTKGTILGKKKIGYRELSMIWMLGIDWLMKLFRNKESKRQLWSKGKNPIEPNCRIRMRNWGKLSKQKAVMEAEAKNKIIISKKLFTCWITIMLKMRRMIWTKLKS